MSFLGLLMLVLMCFNLLVYCRQKMIVENSQIPFAPIATILAALITAIISFVNLILSKEQKTSEFRQAWIDGLRSDLAIFFSSARGLCRTMEEARSLNTTDDDIQNFKFSNDKVVNMRLAAAESLYRIKLRLNNNETEHNKLNLLLVSAINIQNSINIEKGKEYTQALDAIDIALSHSQYVLKIEWERVKKGELPFQIAKYGALIIIVIALGSIFYKASILYSNG